MGDYEAKEYQATIEALADTLQKLRCFKVDCKADGWNWIRLMQQAKSFMYSKYGKREM